MVLLRLQSVPAPTQRFETQHPPPSHVLPRQQGSPGRPQPAPSVVISSCGASVGPASLPGLPAVPIAMSIPASTGVPPVPTTVPPPTPGWPPACEPPPTPPMAPPAAWAPPRPAGAAPPAPPPAAAPAVPPVPEADLLLQPAITVSATSAATPPTIDEPRNPRRGTPLSPMTLLAGPFARSYVPGSGLIARPTEIQIRRRSKHGRRVSRRFPVARR